MAMKVLVADVGGTHWTTAIYDTAANEIRFQKRVDTKTVTEPATYVQAFIDESTFPVTKACLAVAGPVIDGQARLTNVRLSFSVDDLIKKTDLQDVMLINDFAALGNGVATLTSKDCKHIRGKPDLRRPAVLIGAGTGLGKAFLLDDQVYAGEGAHAPLPAENEEELQLVTFLKHKRKSTVSYHDVVSGHGLESLYEFFAHEERRASEIVHLRNAHARDALRLFKKYYARFAQAAVLDVVATGGLFIAGGIVASNPELVDKEFLKEFGKHSSPHFRELLAGIPVTLITNYEVSLRGAAKALSRT